MEGRPEEDPQQRLRGRQHRGGNARLSQPEDLVHRARQSDRRRRVPGRGTIDSDVQRLVPAAPRRVAAKVEALLHSRSGRGTGSPGGPAYGYGNLAITLARPVFDPRTPQAARSSAAVGVHQAARSSACMPCRSPTSATTSKGTSSSSISGTGASRARSGPISCPPRTSIWRGRSVLKAKLNGMRVERLEHGGLLVAATDSPLPEDTDATRDRFWRLDEALQPAFLSRDRDDGNDARHARVLLPRTPAAALNSAYESPRSAESRAARAAATAGVCGIGVHAHRQRLARVVRLAGQQPVRRHHRARRRAVFLRRRQPAHPPVRFRVPHDANDRRRRAAGLPRRRRPGDGRAR